MDNQTTTHKCKFPNALAGFFAQWNLMRWLRLGVGLFLLWQLTQKPDIITGFVSAFFLFQAITNTGCCGASGCSIPAKGNEASRRREGSKEEEIK